MRRRSFPNFIGDFASLQERQNRMEMVMRIIGFSPDKPYTLYVNDGTLNRVLIGKINGDYGIKIVNNAGATIVFADGHITADGITTGSLDAGVVNVINLSASVIVTGELTANLIIGGVLDCSGITVANLDAGSITVGVFLAPNDRFTTGSLSGVKISDGTVTGNKLVAYTIQADNIASNVITADKIAIGTITAVEIHADTITTSEINYLGGNKLVDGSVLAAKIASLNADVVTTGTLTGRKVQTHSSPTYGVKMNTADWGSLAHGYLEFWSDFGDQGLLYYNKNRADFNFEGGDVNVWGANLNMRGGELNDTRKVASGGNDLDLVCGWGQRIFFDAAGAGGDLSMFPTDGDFWATGTKHFRIPHPEDPENKSIQYASVEAPEIILKIRGRATLVKGTATIQLPHHWGLVTETEGITIQLTPVDDCYGLFAPRVGMRRDSFKVKELMGGDSNAEFMWEVTAVRKGYADFNPIQTLEDEAKRVVDSMTTKKEKGENIHQKRRKRVEDLIRLKYKKKTGNVIVDEVADESEKLEKERQLYIKKQKKLDKAKKLFLVDSLPVSEGIRYDFKTKTKRLHRKV